MVATAFTAAPARSDRGRASSRPARDGGRSASARSADERARAQTAAKPKLTVVTRPEPRRSVLPFALICTAIIGVTLALVLMLNISMSSTSYSITRLTMQSRALDDREQALKEEAELLGTPQELSKRAGDLGMVPAAEPAYIDLATGKVVGTPKAAAPAPGQVPAGAAAEPGGLDSSTRSPSEQGDEHGMGGEPR